MSAAGREILVVSPATTAGWRTVEEEIEGSLRRIGWEPRVERMDLGPSRHLRRAWPLVDAVEAAGARAALKRGLASRTPAAVLFLSTTALLAAPVRRMQSQGIMVAGRIDSPAAVNRTGAENAIQRGVERRRLAAADLILAMGPRSAEGLRGLVPEGRLAVVPNPIRVEPPDGPPADPPLVLAYGANPEKKGLDTIAAAWSRLRPGGARLAVAGVDEMAGREFLEERGVAAPEGIEWLGMVPREGYLELLRGAAGFVSASRMEEHGLAQLEAICAGVPLVTTPSAGAYEAEPVARALAPELVPADGSPEALAGALSALLAMDGDQRRGYRSAAQDAVAHLRPAQTDRALADALAALA